MSEQPKPRTWIPRDEVDAPPRGPHWCSDGCSVWFIDFVVDGQFTAGVRISHIMPTDKPEPPGVA